MLVHRFAVLLALCGNAATPAGPAENPLTSIRTCMDDRAAAGSFSGAMLIAERGRVVWQAGYGYADAARRARNTPETRFNIASMGKMFTAVAIAQLADQGRLGFDDPISRHLPDLPTEIGAITIHQLLTHTSGLRDYLRPENRDILQAARTAADLLPLATAGGLAFPPGTESAYSNSGFVVLGAIVERLSGQTYADYVADHIFRPAGMTSTSLNGDSPRAAAMTRRSPDGGVSEGPPHPAPAFGSHHASPAGGETSTIGDMMRFAEALRMHRLTRPATTERLWQAHLIPSRQSSTTERTSYGYGFNRTDVGDRRFVGHGGGSLGINGQLEIDPEAQRVFVALSNYDPPGATAAVLAARRAFLGGDRTAVCAMPPSAR